MEGVEKRRVDALSAVGWNPTALLAKPAARAYHPQTSVSNRRAHFSTPSVNADLTGRLPLPIIPGARPNPIQEGSMKSHLPPEIEVVRNDAPRGEIRHALFDFDGTLSLIREGWQQVMVPMMVEVLLETPRHESREELERVVREYVDRLTGKQTIYQMLQLQEEVRARGGEPLDALVYKRRYLDLLWQRIAHRVQGLKEGRIPREEMLLPGSIALLEELRARGIICYLASGTDLPYVHDEAEALGIAGYFAGGIYGALDNWKDFSKAMLIERILQEHRLSGSALITFGDGFVEIENTVAVGGVAVGVASDEVHPGRIDAWKRERLIRAGAHFIVPDHRASLALVRYLCGEPTEEPSPLKG
jgi:phosphoglycolate phosphatase